MHLVCALSKLSGSERRAATTEGVKKKGEIRNQVVDGVSFARFSFLFQQRAELVYAVLRERKKTHKEQNT